MSTTWNSKNLEKLNLKFHSAVTGVFLCIFIPSQEKNKAIVVYIQICIFRYSHSWLIFMIQSLTMTETSPNTERRCAGVDLAVSTSPPFTIKSSMTIEKISHTLRFHLICFNVQLSWLQEFSCDHLKLYSIDRLGSLVAHSNCQYHQDHLHSKLVACVYWQVNLVWSSKLRYSKASI